jgi:hypothetical protein
MGQRSRPHERDRERSQHRGIGKVPEKECVTTPCRVLFNLIKDHVFARDLILAVAGSCFLRSNDDIISLASPLLTMILAWSSGIDVTKACHPC